MEILLLDECFIYQPDDAFLKRLSRLGKYHFYLQLSETQRSEILPKVEVLFTNQALVTRSLIEKMPSLKYVGLMATGFNHVDMEAVRERGIAVTNVPAYSSESVAQGVFAHILNIYNRVARIDAQVKAHRWVDFGQEEYWQDPVWELHGKTLGIVGLGNIGMSVARIASQGFGMKVLAYTSRDTSILPIPIGRVGLRQLLSESHVVSLHCPLNDKTRHIINEETLGWMRPSAVLINTGRGGLVDELALFEALSKHRLAAAGLDVLEQEPPSSQNPLLGLDNCFFTAHNCFATREARSRLLDTCYQNLVSYVDGTPVNRVDILG